MSKKCDEMPQIRVSEENRQWMDDYRKILALPISYRKLGNMLMDKGRKHMPMDRLKEVLKVLKK